MISTNLWPHWYDREKSSIPSPGHVLLCIDALIVLHCDLHCQEKKPTIHTNRCEWQACVSKIHMIFHVHLFSHNLSPLSPPEAHAHASVHVLQPYSAAVLSSQQARASGCSGPYHAVCGCIYNLQFRTIHWIHQQHKPCRRSGCDLYLKRVRVAVHDYASNDHCVTCNIIPRPFRRILPTENCKLNVKQPLL